MEMLGGVFIFRGITATHVSAGKTEPKMNPGVAHFQTLLAALGVRMYRLDFLAVRAVSHGSFFLSESRNRDTNLKPGVSGHRGEGDRAIELAHDAADCVEAEAGALAYRFCGEELLEYMGLKIFGDARAVVANLHDHGVCV